MKLVDIKNIEQVEVYKNNTLAGKISRTSHGCLFEYNEEYLAASGPAIAFNLPTSNKNYSTSGDNLLPFFAGLLPEGLRLTALVSALKTSSDDMFSLLAASGTDCIGDVHIGIPGFKAPKKPTPKLELKEVIFSELFEASISAPNYQMRLEDPSIAGVHAKLSSQMISFPVSLVKKKKRYILKLGQKTFPKLIENEFFFMSLAQACGLAVAQVNIVYDKNQTAGLLVERFDRIFSKANKTMEKLHQEDACQLMDRYPQDKYRISLRDIASTMQKFCSAPIIEIAKLVQLLAYSYIIGNGDLHAKNISLITEPENNRTILAPAYDLLSTLVYGDTHMALKLEGKDQNLSLKYFLQFAAAFDVRPEAIRTILYNLCVNIESRISQITQIGFDAKKTKYLQRSIEERVFKLKSELA